MGHACSQTAIGKSLNETIQLTPLNPHNGPAKALCIADVIRKTYQARIQHANTDKCGDILLQLKTCWCRGFSVAPEP